MHSMQAFIINTHYKNNHTDNVNGVTFVTRKHMSPEGPIFDNLSCTWEFSFVFYVISLEIKCPWICGELKDIPLLKETVNTYLFPYLKRPLDT